MNETEEFNDGVWAIRRPDGKIVGKLLVSTATGGSKQEDWYLVTTVPAGNSAYAPYVWPSATNPDITHRYERVGNAASGPGFPSGTTYDQYRATPAKV